MSSARVHCSCIALAPGYAVFLPCILDAEPTYNTRTLCTPRQTTLPGISEDFGPLAKLILPPISVHFGPLAKSNLPGYTLNLARSLN